MDLLVDKAKNYAMVKHKGQKRSDGSPYIFHPFRVTQYLSIACPTDTNLICAGALHDVIEDCSVRLEELESEFNKDIASLVWEVTKYKPDPNKKALFPNLKTQRGIILKFFDRADNLSDMKGWSAKKKGWYLNTSQFWQSE